MLLLLLLLLLLLPVVVVVVAVVVTGAVFELCSEACHPIIFSAQAPRTRHTSVTTTRQMTIDYIFAQDSLEVRLHVMRGVVSGCAVSREQMIGGGLVTCSSSVMSRDRDVA